jgi:hypothetical protein
MPVPQTIKIRREKGYHTDCIGKYGDGNQFMGFVVAAPFRDRKKRKTVLDWYAVVHKFDPKGRHLRTEAWRAGTAPGVEREVVEKAEKRLAEMVAALGKVRYGNIKVSLFRVEIDGHTFGLVDASEPDEDYESIHLLPNELAFFEPWDGTYDT